MPSVASAEPHTPPSQTDKEPDLNLENLFNEKMRRYLNKLVTDKKLILNDGQDITEVYSLNVNNKDMINYYKFYNKNSSEISDNDEEGVITWSEFERRLEQYIPKKLNK